MTIRVPFPAPAAILATLALMPLGCASAPEAAAPAALDPTGLYTFSTTVQGRAVDGQMRITGEAGAYGGSAYTDVTGELPFSLIAVDGSRILLVTDTPDGPVEIRLVLEGDTFTGDWAAGADGGSIRGRRVRE